MIDTLRDSLSAQQAMASAVQTMKIAVIVCDCLLAGILGIILAALIVLALTRRNRPRMRDATRPRILPTPPRYTVAPELREPPKHKRRMKRKRNKPPSGRKA